MKQSTILPLIFQLYLLLYVYLQNNKVVLHHAALFPYTLSTADTNSVVHFRTGEKHSNTICNGNFNKLV